MVWFEMEADGRRLGRIEFQLFDDLMPRTAENFRSLADGAYQGTSFDTVIRNFMIQGGSSSSRDEIVLLDDQSSSLKHDAPYLLSTDGSSSAFIVTLRPSPHLDNKHAVFGKVSHGEEAIEAISRIPVDKSHKPLQKVIIVACGSQETKDEDDEEVQEEEQEQEQEEREGRTEMEKRLLRVRMLLNKGRKANAAAAKEERSRKKDERARGVGARERAEERERAREKWLAGLEKRGVTKDKAYLYETADAADRRNEKQKRKEQRKAAFGWDVFNSDTLHKAYERRVQDLPSSTREEEEEEEDEDPTSYGQQDAPQDEDAVDRMVAELEKGDKRKAAFSRRRAHVQEADVDYINDRNKVFNKKIKRAFDKYTVEIRQNLERGTAV